MFVRLNLIVDWLMLVVGVCAVTLGIMCRTNGMLEIYGAILLVLSCFALTVWYRR